MNINKDNMIFGRNPVYEALEAGNVIKLYAVTGFSFAKITDLAKEKCIPLVYISSKEMQQICTGSHQGIIGITKGYHYSSLEEIIERGKNKKQPVILLLDGIEDPHNLGAILRSADIFDVSGIVIPKHNSVSLNATVAKTSAGAINYVPVCMVNNLNNAISKLKESGYWVVSSDGSAKVDYQDLTYDFKTVLVIGSEGKGVSRLVLSNSDYVVKIPMFGSVNSLNASVATGILLARIRTNYGKG